MYSIVCLIVHSEWVYRVNTLCYYIIQVTINRSTHSNTWVYCVEMWLTRHTVAQLLKLYREATKLDWCYNLSTVHYIKLLLFHQLYRLARPLKLREREIKRRGLATSWRCLSLKLFSASWSEDCSSSCIWFTGECSCNWTTYAIPRHGRLRYHDNSQWQDMHSSSNQTISLQWYF